MGVIVIPGESVTVTGETFLDRYFAESARREAAGDRSTRRRRPEVAEAYVATLDFRLKDGTRVALPYATLLKSSFDPSKGITLEYSTDTVMISGRNLEPVYKAIAQHRLSALGESGERAVAFDQEYGEPVITAIRIEPADSSPSG